ncbi:MULTISPECIES: hypothetical protein [Acinetobacter]|uniref:Uncharacterized protein n=1 Tax=Acinetobacter indicus TaxID=756892 RepID=A0A6C0Y705_9GAMM|nr:MULTISPECIES: hypothetical protein [Acinetobacter]QIC71916.1 hypothetical protein FSC09_16120 [Acinetobacter indicus]QKQ71453.1 hypothetical protein E5Y90_14575 [Acinetobacter sp. 10FS3-1]
MNTQSLASQLIVAPTSKNEVAVLFNMCLANFEYDSEPTDRLYESNSHTVAVIYENSAHGVAVANAHLFAFFLKFIEPQDIHGELRESLSVPLLTDRTEPFSNIEEYKLYLEQLGYGLGHCGFIGEVFGHALTNDEERSTTTLASLDYMNEFTKECSYCAIAVDSLVGNKKQLNQLMISALRHPGSFPGFILPLHKVDCIALGEPMINPEWIAESIELPTGDWVPSFNVIELIT